jgi:beta-barrel assembly-enhancing protease
MKYGKHFRGTHVLALLILLASATLLANVDPKKGRVTANPTSGNRYSLEQEVDYGRQAIPEIEKELPVLQVDHPVSKYINALGNRLAAKAPGYKLPYTFRVVNQKEINAFALAGGPIYVNTGTIAAASEAELAGVMGHEISHVVMRHSTRQASRQSKAAIPLAILSGVLGASVGGWAGSLAQMGISIGAGSVFTKYSRDAETEADMVGAQIIYDTGFDPHAIVTFFKKLKEQQGSGGGPSFLASHPDPGNRARDVASILARFPSKKYQQGDSAEFVAAKNALSGITPAKVGSPSNATPAVALRRLPAKDLTIESLKPYEHGAFPVSYPANWEIVGDPKSSLTTYPKGGADRETVAYGTIVSTFTPGSGTRELAEATRQLISSIRDTNPALRQTGNPVSLTVGGRAAKSVEMVGNSAIQENGQPIPERIRLVAVQGKGGLILYRVFIAPSADFDGLRPGFDRILQSFTLR